MIETILKYTIPVVTAIMGFITAFLLEKYRNKKKIDEEKKKQEEDKRRLFWNAFLEAWENNSNILGMINSLERFGDEYRKRYPPLRLNDIKFKKLENCKNFKEDEYYFIYKISMLKKKVSIINNTLIISWSDINFHKLEILLNYLKTEQNIFFQFILKFVEYLKIDVNEFKCL